MTTDKKPTDLATIADLQDAVAHVQEGVSKEVGDIARAWPAFSYGDPTNNVPAAREVLQSIGAIGALGIWALYGLVSLAEKGLAFARDMGWLGG